MSDGWFLVGNTANFVKAEPELVLGQGFSMRDLEVVDRGETAEGDLKWTIKGRLYHKGKPAKFTSGYETWWGSIGDGKEPE